MIHKFYAVGLGPGDPELIPYKTLRILQEADIIFEVKSPNGICSLSGAILDALPVPLTAKRVPLLFKMTHGIPQRMETAATHAETIANSLKEGNRCVFVTIGDSLLYSTWVYLQSALRHLLPELQTEAIPGITSYQAVAAHADIPLAFDNQPLSVIPDGRFPEYAPNGPHTLIFLKAYRKRNELMQVLQSKGYKIIYGSRIGTAESFLSSDITEISTHPLEYLSLIIASYPNPEEITKAFHT